jgi:hypothetical protein
VFGARISKCGLGSVADLDRQSYLQWIGRGTENIFVIPSIWMGGVKQQTGYEYLFRPFLQIAYSPFRMPKE